MNNTQASARYALVEFNDDGTSGITSDIHFFADIDKAIMRFSELLDNYREVYPDFDELISNRSLVSSHIADGWEFGYDAQLMEFNYYNWDDDYVRVYFARVQANTSISIRY